MSRHVMKVSSGLELHAGYCRSKGCLFAQIYRAGEVTPVQKRLFGHFGIEALEDFVKQFKIEAPLPFLQALINDAVYKAPHSTMIWSEDGSVEFDSMLLSNPTIQ